MTMPVRNVQAKGRGHHLVVKSKKRDTYRHSRKESQQQEPTDNEAGMGRQKG